MSRATTSGRGSISAIHTTPSRWVARPSTRPRTSAAISSVSGASGTQDQLHVRRELGGRSQEQRQALLSGDPADEDDAGPVGVDSQLAHPVGRGDRCPVVGVDAVVHHAHPVGVDGGVAAQDVVAHGGAHRDDRVGCFVCRPSRPSWTRRSRRRAAPPSTAASARGCGRSPRGARRAAAWPGGRPCWRTRCGSARSRCRHSRRPSRGRRRASGWRRWPLPVRPGRRTRWCRPRSAHRRSSAPGRRSRPRSAGRGPARRRGHRPLRRRQVGTPGTARRFARVEPTRVVTWVTTTFRT